MATPSGVVTARDGAGAEPKSGGAAGAPRGQCEQHVHPVHLLRHGAQVHGEPVLGGGLPGHLDAGELRSAGVGQPARQRAAVRPARRRGEPQVADDPALLVAEGDRGHHGGARGHPDLQSVAGQRMVLPPYQFGRHASRPLFRVCSVSLSV